MNKTELIVLDNSKLYFFEDDTEGAIDIYDIVFMDVIKDMFCEMWSCNGFLTEC